MRVQNIRLKMIRENIGEYKVRDFEINNQAKVARIVEEIFDLSSLTQEHFVVLYLNTKNKIVGADTLNVGTVNASIVDVRAIFTKALLVNANHIITAHNHPSGDCRPSREDFAVWDRLRKSGELLSIDVIDNIVIGDGELYSEMGRESSKF